MMGVMSVDIIHHTLTIATTTAIIRIAIIRLITTLFTTAIHGIIRLTPTQAIITVAPATIHRGKIMLDSLT